MIYKRHAEITIETHSLTIIRTRGGRADDIYCRRCNANVATFRHAHAALIFRVAAPELERLSQIDSIHTTDDGDSDAFCGNSLTGFFNKEIRYVQD